MLDLYIYKINEQEIDKDLSSSILKHCKRYKNNDAYLQSIFAWSKLRYTLRKYYDIDINKEILIFNNKEPLLLNHKIFFNISHTERLVAIAISDKKCSCDIQSFIPLNQVDLLGSRLLSREEKDQLKTPLEKQDYLTKIWTHKECYLKLNGFDINIIRGRMREECVYNTFKIMHWNLHYYCSIMNKDNEKVNKIMENEEIVKQPVSEPVVVPPIVETTAEPAKEEKVEQPKQKGGAFGKVGWITGIVSLATCWTGLIGLITGIVAIVFSSLGKSKKQQAINDKWAGKAKKSLTFGIVGTAVSAVMIIVWSIVISYIMWKYIIW